MSEYREESNRAKAARRGIVEQRPVGGKKRQAKQVVVEYRYPNWPFKWAREWRKFGAYADTETAQAVIAAKTRSATSAEYRIKP